MTARFFDLLARHCSSLAHLKAVFNQAFVGSSSASTRLTLRSLELVSPLAVVTSIELERAVVSLKDLRTLTLFDLRLSADDWRLLLAQCVALRGTSSSYLSLSVDANAALRQS